MNIIRHEQVTDNSNAYCRLHNNFSSKFHTIPFLLLSLNPADCIYYLNRSSCLFYLFIPICRIFRECIRLLFDLLKKKNGNIFPIQNMLPREKASCFELICPLYQYDRNSSGHLVCTIFIAHGIHQQMERKWNFWLAHFGVYSLTSTWEVMSSCEYFVD